MIDALTYELEQAKAENRYLRHQLNNTFYEALRLRQAIEQMYATAHMTLHVLNTGDTDEKCNG